VHAHTIAIIQPTNVHPDSRLSTKMATPFALCLKVAMSDGKKYIEKMSIEIINQSAHGSACGVLATAECMMSESAIAKNNITTMTTAGVKPRRGI
jgi:hypothetical protein